MTGELEFAQASIGRLLEEVAAHFKPGARITLIVRSPLLEAKGKDADFVMTDDTLELAIATLLRRRVVLASASNAEGSR